MVPIGFRAVEFEADPAARAIISRFEIEVRILVDQRHHFVQTIGFDEQRERLQERLDDPTKHWKFSMGDIEVRKQWPQYQDAYSALLQATHTPWAPWTIVPADSKTHRNLMIATLVRDKLKSLKLRYPPDNPELKGLRVQ